MPGLIDMHSHLAMQESLYEGREISFYIPKFFN